MTGGPPVDLSESDGMPLDTPVLRAATDKIMTDVAALVGKLRDEDPPAEPFHPAVARRKQRAELRQLAEQAGGTTQAANTAQDTQAGGRVDTCCPAQAAEDQGRCLARP